MNLRGHNAPTRIALLGAGYIAEWHAKAVRSIPHLLLYGVCDQNATRAAAIAKSFGIARTFRSIDELCSDPLIDSVHVLLPPNHHFSAALQLLQKGKHVFLEKPMCLTEGECDQLIATADRVERRIGVGHNFLFHPAYERLRSDIRSGRLGWIDHISVAWHRELPQLTQGPFSNWMLRESGNLLLEIGPHAIAPLIDILGVPMEMEVQPNRPLQLPSGTRIPRHWSLTCMYPKATANISLSFTPGFTNHSITIRGNLAEAHADLEKNTYVLRRHTASMEDIDRFRILRYEGKLLKKQGEFGLFRFAQSKFSKSVSGNPYGQSIREAIEAFYRTEIDHRVSGLMGRTVISTCCRAIAKSNLADECSTPQIRYPISSPLSPRILVLGATGFIGQELTLQLAQKHEVRVLARDPDKMQSSLFRESIQMVQGDIAEADSLAKALDGIDYVYHLAKPNVKTWSDYKEQDIEVTDRIAKACVASGVKMLIYAGTITSYYSGNRAGVIREDTPLDPEITSRNYYSRAKAMSERNLIALRDARQLPLIIVRPGIVLGRGGSPYHWGVGMWHFNSVCQVWGRGDNPLPFVLVEDVAHAMANLIGRTELIGESFNLVGDIRLTAREYLDELDAAANMKIIREYISPGVFYRNDFMKWCIKTVMRKADRRFPSYRDWESRTERAHYDCTRTKTRLNWHPENNRSEFIRKGICLPVEDLQK